MLAPVAFAPNAAPARGAAENEALIPGPQHRLNFQIALPQTPGRCLEVWTIGILRISENDVQHVARDWTRARAWLQCVAGFSKENLNE